MKRKIAAASLAAVLLAGTLAACSGEGDKTGKEAKETAAAPAKKYTFKLYTTRIQPNPESEAFKKVLEKLGHQLEITAVPDGDYNQKLNLYYASNEMPDIFTYSNQLSVLKGGTASFTEEELKTYMPLSYAAAIKQFEEYGIKKETVLNRFTVDGTIRGFHIGQLETTFPYGNLIRKDLLEELGKPMPKTIADWDELLKAYKAKYPTKYPLAARGKSVMRQSFHAFLAAYGVTFESWHLKDDKLVYGPFLPGMRDALATLSRWYKAGYINPEWVTMETAAYNNEFTNGNTLYWEFANSSTIIKPPYAPGSLPDQLAAKNPKASFDWMPYPVSNPSVKPAISTNEAILNAPVNFGKHLEKDRDKLHAAMQVVDKLTSDKELWMMRQFGIEGKTYDMVDGIPVVKKELNNDDGRTREGFGWFYGGRPGVNWELERTIKQPAYLEHLKVNIQNPDGIYGKNKNDWVFNHVNGPLTTPSGENLDAKGKTKLEEWYRTFAEVVTGRQTLEDFDKFIASYKKEVGDDMTEAANRLYLKQWQK